MTAEERATDERRAEEDAERRGTGDVEPRSPKVKDRRRSLRLVIESNSRIETAKVTGVVDLSAVCISKRV